MKQLSLTNEQIELLNNILFNDCSYLETCNEDEFSNYLAIKTKLNGGNLSCIVLKHLEE